MVSPIFSHSPPVDAYNRDNSICEKYDDRSPGETSKHSSESDTSEDSSQSHVSEDKSSKHVKEQSMKKRTSVSVRKEGKSKTVQKLEVKLGSVNYRNIESRNNSNLQIEEITQRRHPTVKYYSFLTSQLILWMFIPFILCVVAYNRLNTSETPTPISTLSLDEIKEIFPQDNAFWISIETGITEITNFNKPSIIILLHKHNVHNFTELLDNITIYASCILNEDCSVKPIVIEGNDLNTQEMIEDYGIIIDHYSPLLNEKHIMVVKNMDNILGSVAQAFHYICDEFSPLVRKSLIIFTIGVDKFKGKALDQAVNILNAKWNDVEPDKLEALITRVSSIVLHVK